METPLFGKRTPHRIRATDANSGALTARELVRQGKHVEAFDVYEQLTASFPDLAIPFLAELYDVYQTLPNRSRYHLYVARHFDFGIKPGDKVIDVGSGHIPFPLATHLSDITLTDHGYGRAGAPFKHIDGKPVFECNIEKLPFADGEFDFAYCSHVLEHVDDPIKACRELMRVAKRGYLETPNRAKDLFLNSGKVSNHRWIVDTGRGGLIFRAYSPELLEGLQSKILMEMHTAPKTDREKAFSALIYLKADMVNTMLLWEKDFNVCVLDAQQNVVQEYRAGSNTPAAPKQERIEVTSKTESSPAPRLKFLQVHPFYPHYLEQFYARHPDLGTASFDIQIQALLDDAFSSIHIFAPEMKKLGYDSQFIVTNCPPSQVKWMQEHGKGLKNQNDWMCEIVREQIETLKPDVLYLSEPIQFDSRFVRTLSHRPKLIVGWRASDIPGDTDWSSFDLFLSSLTGMRETALKLGARKAVHFYPGFPAWIYEKVRDIQPSHDVAFIGSWNPGQYRVRNKLLTRLASEASGSAHPFSCALHISGPQVDMPPEVARLNLGPKFGMEMQRALRSGRIAFDARGEIGVWAGTTARANDLAARETANMRIFEATGSGIFLLTQHFDNLSSYFEIGREIETYRDESEMIEKIRHYIAHPKEREEIARQGHERCMRDHSLNARARAFDQIIRQHLPAPTAATKAIEVQLQDKAREEFAAKNYSEALRILNKTKATRRELRDTDYLRAQCFLNNNEPHAAIEVLREELRFFPDHGEARALLEKLAAQYTPADTLQTGDEEFEKLLKKIRPYTMLSKQRLFSLFSLAKQVCIHRVPGNFVECGVAAGGSSALMAWVISKYSDKPRKIFSFDTFEGMPEPTAFDQHEGVEANATGWGTGTCAAPIRSLMDIATQLGVENGVVPVKGFFQDTLPVKRSEIGPISMLHLDADWYESTKVILDNLFDQIVESGALQVDDYGHWEGCKRAVHEFEQARGLRFNLKQVDYSGVWFQKLTALQPASC